MGLQTLFWAVSPPPPGCDLPRVCKKIPTLCPSSHGSVQSKHCASTSWRETVLVHKVALPFPVHVCVVCIFPHILAFLDTAKGSPDVISHRDLNPPSLLRTLQGLWQCTPRIVRVLLSAVFFPVAVVEERKVSYVLSQISIVMVGYVGFSEFSPGYIPSFVFDTAGP